MVVPIGNAMPFRRDLFGQSFNAWVVTGSVRQEPGAGRNLQWWCRCECGTERWVQAQSLVDGRTKSCGCKKRTSFQSVGVAEYRSWMRMRERCSPNNKEKAKYYAERGITICPQWESFDQFLADMGPVPHPGWTLDRIDNDQGYAPGNCRWADCQIQAQNRRQNQRRGSGRI